MRIDMRTRHTASILALALCVGAFFALPPTAEAAVTVDSVGPSSAGTSCSNCRTLTWNHTVSGTGTLLVVGVGIGENPDTGINVTVTYDGVSMTSAGVKHSGNLSVGFVQMFYLVSPHGGTHTVSVDQGFTGAGGATIIGGSVSFNGVDQSTPVRNIASNAANSTSVSVNVTSAAGDMVVDAAVTGTLISSSGQTNRWLKNLNPNTGAGNVAQSTAAGAASVTMSYTGSSDVWAIIGMDIVANANSVLARPPNNLGLVGYWSFDDGTGTKATDFSGLGYTGTIAGTPNWVNGRFGKALNFDASTNYVDLGNPTAMRATSCTVSAWIKTPPAADNDENLLGVSKGAAGTDSFTVEFGTNATNGIANELIYVSHVGSDFSEEAYVTTNRAELFDNRWHHVVVTEDTSTHIYLDGVSKTVTTGVNADTGACMGDVNLDTFRIGNILWAGSNINFFNGSIDDVRVYNRALSATEIANLYQRSASVRVGDAKTLQHGTTLESGLVGYWTFDGGDMTWSSDIVGTSTDRSGQGNDGKLVSMNRKTSVDGGALGQALSFDGSSGFIDLAKPSSLSLTGGISVSAWIKANSTTCASYCDIVANYDSSGQTAQYEFTVHNGTLLFDAASSNVFENDTSTFSLSSGTWYHVVAVRDAANTATQIYVNGSATTVNRVGSVTVPSAGFGRTAIGRAGDFAGQYFPGMIDDVRIYNRALSAAEVKQLYNLGMVTIRP